MADMKMADMENDSPGKWGKITTPEIDGKMYYWKMMEWKMTDLEKGGKFQYWKMEEKAKLENNGMENDSPGKWWKIAGLENGGKSTTGKWWNGK